MRTRKEARDAAALADQLVGGTRVPARARGDDAEGPPERIDAPATAKIGEVVGAVAEYVAGVRPLGAEVASSPEQPKKPALFATAHAGPGISPDFQRIVEATYAVDVFRDYDDLERHLEVGDQRGDYGTLRQHLDAAEARARRAHRLYLGAKLELVGWEADHRRVLGEMRERARTELEREKEDGARKKVISKDDVDDRVADLFPDEWVSQERTKAKMRGVVDDLEHLTKRWDAKCVDLRVLLETLRK